MAWLIAAAGSGGFPTRPRGVGRQRAVAVRITCQLPGKCFINLSSELNASASTGSDDSQSTFYSSPSRTGLGRLGKAVRLEMNHVGNSSVGGSLPCQASSLQRYLLRGFHVCVPSYGLNRLPPQSVRG